LMVKAVNESICLALGDGAIEKYKRPGIVIMVQTFGDELNFNPHIHLLITDGHFKYSDPDKPIFYECKKWNMGLIKELFRQKLIFSLVKNEVLPEHLAKNLLSWKHSGFSVHSSEPFNIDNKDELITRLRYASRPIVAKSRLEYKDNLVTYKTKNGKKLNFSPLDFIARLTSHVPDHYLNIRRYLGFYASNIQRTLPKRDLENIEALTTEEYKPKYSTWSKLIARIYKEIPTICPKCGKEMKLREFIRKEETIEKIITWSNRAPPKIKFPSFDDVSGNIVVEYDIVQTGF